MILGALLLSLFSGTGRLLLACLTCLYLGVAMRASVRIALAAADVRYVFVMPLVFLAFHISYGLGAICGLLKLLRF